MTLDTLPEVAIRLQRLAWFNTGAKAALRFTFLEDDTHRIHLPDLRPEAWHAVSGERITLSLDQTVNARDRLCRRCCTNLSELTAESGLAADDVRAARELLLADEALRRLTRLVDAFAAMDGDSPQPSAVLDALGAVYPHYLHVQLSAMPGRRSSTAYLQQRVNELGADLGAAHFLERRAAEFLGLPTGSPEAFDSPAWAWVDREPRLVVGTIGPDYTLTSLGFAPVLASCAVTLHGDGRCGVFRVPAYVARTATEVGWLVEGSQYIMDVSDDEVLATAVDLWAPGVPDSPLRSFACAVETAAHVVR